jgi:hypothetical protein
MICLWQWTSYTGLPKLFHCASDLVWFSMAWIMSVTEASSSAIQRYYYSIFITIFVLWTNLRILLRLNHIIYFAIYCITVQLSSFNSLYVLWYWVSSLMMMLLENNFRITLKCKKYSWKHVITFRQDAYLCLKSLFLGGSR